MFKMNKNKVIIIILATFLSFALGGGYYYFFCLSSKNEEVHVPEDKNKEVSVPEDVYEVAQNDVSLFLQKIVDYEQKAFNEKNINQEIVDKNMKILLDQGLWKGLGFESEYREYLDKFQSSQDTFALRISELLEKVKKEKNLESFREELEKLSEETKKDINENVETFAKFANRAQEEAEKPMPISATWIGLLFLAIICPIISFYILKFLRESLNCEVCVKSKVLNIIFLMIICFLLQFLIFPLINCLFSLKMSTLKEIHKHYRNNNFKSLFLCVMFICLNCSFGFECCREEEGNVLYEPLLKDNSANNVQMDNNVNDVQIGNDGNGAAPISGDQ